MYFFPIYWMFSLYLQSIINMSMHNLCVFVKNINDVNFV